MRLPIPAYRIRIQGFKPWRNRVFGHYGLDALRR
jgi:hypothetical protein